MTVRQNSYLESNRHLCAVFQTGKPVQEYELNEAALTQLAFGTTGVKIAAGTGVGVAVPTVSSPAANQITVSVCQLVVDGLYIDVTAPVTVTGLTTPGGARTDYLYAEVVMSEIADPTPLAPLGAVSNRKQLSVSFKVIENAAVPASTGRVLDGGTQRFSLFKLDRIASSDPTAGTVTPTYTLLASRTLARITDAADGDVTKIYAGTDSLVDTREAEPLGIHDGVMTGARTNFTDNGADNAGKTLWGKGDDSSPTPASESFFRAINGRSFITCGDGVDSVGDFNGAVSPKTALTTFWANHPGKPVTLFLKRGAYVLASGIVCAGPLKIIGEGPAEANYDGTAEGTTLEYAGTVIETDYALEMENIGFLGDGVAIRANSTTYSRGVSARGCSFRGSVVVEDTAFGIEKKFLTNFQNCLFRSYGSVGPSYEPVLIVTDNTASCGPVSFRDCSFVSPGFEEALVAVGRNSGVGASTFESLLFDGCEFVTSENTTVTDPHPTTGILRFLDNVVTNPVTVKSLVYRNCIIRNSLGTGDGGPWWNLSPGKRDGTATFNATSAINHLLFDSCQFHADANVANGELFRLVCRRYVASTGSANERTNVEFRSCLFHMNAKTTNENVADAVSKNKSSVYVEAHDVIFRDARIHRMNSQSTTGSTGAATDWWSWFQLNPLDHPTNHGVVPGNVLIDGVSFEAVEQSGAAALATDAIGVYGRYFNSRIVVRRLDWNAIGGLGIPVVGGYILGVRTDAAYNEVSSCTFRGEDTDAALFIQEVAGGLGPQTFIVDGNTSYNMIGPWAVGSLNDQTIVRVSSNYLLSSSATPGMDGITLRCGPATGTGAAAMVSNNIIRNFTGVAVLVNACHVTMVGNTFRGNNGGGAVKQTTIGSIATITAIGNVCQTAGGAIAGLDLTVAAGAPAPGAVIGGDTNDVAPFGTFTNGVAMRLNFATLVH